MSLLVSKKPVFDGQGGSYYSWSSSTILGEAKLGGGRLLLKPLGFALPHYADSSKIGYVLQGSGKVGYLLPKDSKEKVLRLKKGDIIPVPFGSVSWWFNDRDTDFNIVFLGETSKARIPGDFTYFLLAGTQGLFNGFSNDLLARSLGFTQEEANKIVTSQKGVMIIKLKESPHNIPDDHDDSYNNKVVFNTETAKPSIKVEKGGELVRVTGVELPFLKGVGLSAVVKKIDKNALSLPEFSSDAAFQMIYVARGSGRVEVVNATGESVLKSTVEAGQLVVVPSFFVVSKLAGEEGMECFIVTTNPEPMITPLVGRGSVWAALAPEIMQISLNITPELEENMKKNMSKNNIFVPSPN